MAEPQPPEGLRKIALAAGAKALVADETYGDLVPLEYGPGVAEVVTSAVLAALFEAPGVRLELGASHDSCEHWGIWPTEEALSKWLAAREGWRRTWRLIIAEPPVSSTGEETSGG